MQAQIWNKSQWIAITDPEALRVYFEGNLREAGFKILEFIEHHFNPYGYTALWLLGESHFAVHTFPEFGRTYIELSSCNEEYYQKFIGQIKELREIE